MPSTVDKFGSLKGSDDHKDSKGGRFGLTSAELHAFQPPLIGEHYYYTPGAYTWICPPAITSVSVVCVGGGGGAIQHNYYTLFLSTCGGGGGTLAYKNNIPVVPGQGYDLVVGAGGTAYTQSAGSIPALPAGNGGQSWFNNTSTVAAGGGYGGQCSWAVGSDQQQSAAPVGDGGGRGGYAQGFAQVHPIGGGIAGGSGAGGYAGDGGGMNWPNVVAPSGGAGAVGYPGHMQLYSNYGLMNFDHNGGPGGGVGPYGLTNTPGNSIADHGLSGSDGRHASLADPTPQYKAIPGGVGNWDYSSGTHTTATGPEQNDASASNAGIHGGGGGNAGAGPDLQINMIQGIWLRMGPAGNGGNGCVRIIWGPGRTFPSTLTDEASSNGNVSFN